MFEEEKSPSKGLFWVIGILLLIVIVGASTWFYLNRTPETARTVTVTPTANTVTTTTTVSDANDALVAELSSLDTELTDIETDTASGEDNAPNL